MTEVIILGSFYEYRQQGGEIHRRPVNREGIKPQDSAWLVLHKEEVPYQVREHFTQSQNKSAVN